MCRSSRTICARFARALLFSRQAYLRNRSPFYTGHHCSRILGAAPPPPRAKPLRPDREGPRPGRGEGRLIWQPSFGCYRLCSQECRGSAMSTPARRRLMRDFRRLQNDPPSGVTGAPMDNNILAWQVCTVAGMGAGGMAARRGRLPLG